MGRKQRDLSFMKPFCYYCERTFDCEIFLHQHQKAVHFTCHLCNKKFPSSDSMKIHYKGKHEMVIDKINNAKPGKQNATIKIFGMQGVPRNEVDKWIIEGSSKYWSKLIREQEQKARKEQRENEKQLRQLMLEKESMPAQRQEQ